MKRHGASLRVPQRTHRALLGGLLVLLAIAGCNGGEAEAPRKLTYEDARAQVPLEGDDREPLFWRVDPFPDADAAAAAEAVQYYVVVFDVVGDTRPINEDFFDLMSHFATEERITETRGWFPGPKSPSPTSIDYTGPRWMWIMDVTELSDAELGVALCTDFGWYGYHPDGIFRKVEDRYHQDWGLRGYVLRQVDDAGNLRWKVHDTRRIATMLPEAKLEALREECIAWATHDWEGD